MPWGEVENRPLAGLQEVAGGDQPGGIEGIKEIEEIRREGRARTGAVPILRRRGDPPEENNKEDDGKEKGERRAWEREGGNGTGEMIPREDWGGNWRKRQRQGVFKT